MCGCVCVSMQAQDWLGCLNFLPLYLLWLGDELALQPFDTRQPLQGVNLSSIITGGCWGPNPSSHEQQALYPLSHLATEKNTCCLAWIFVCWLFNMNIWAFGKVLLPRNVYSSLCTHAPPTSKEVIKSLLTVQNKGVSSLDWPLRCTSHLSYGHPVKDYCAYWKCMWHLSSCWHLLVSPWK